MAQNNDTQYFGQQLQYPLDDPTASFQSAMRRSGINPYMPNPFVTQLQKMAQGARIAFLAHGGPPGDRYMNPSEDYGNYLTNAIQGGNLVGDFQRVASNFGGIVQAVKDYDKKAMDGNLSGINDSPYYAALNDIFGADGGMGALSAYASLRSPLMGALGTSYTRGLQAAGQSQLNKFYQQGDYQSSPWDWLFPGKVTNPF